MKIVFAFLLILFSFTTTSEMKIDINDQVFVKFLEDHKGKQIKEFLKNLINNDIYYKEISPFESPEYNLVGLVVSLEDSLKITLFPNKWEHVKVQKSKTKSWNVNDILKERIDELEVEVKYFSRVESGFVETHILEVIKDTNLYFIIESFK